MFWNVENAFWPDDDPQRTGDDEFTPGGDRHWTHGRLRHKLDQLTRVVLAAGRGRVPMLVGLAEVEGDSVMHCWTHRTALRKAGYRYVVASSPDVRGICTALLYQPSDFRLYGAESLMVPMPQGLRPTRDLLHAWGRLMNGDTLDVMVCHLPSQLGGSKATRPARRATWRRVAQVVDSLQSVRGTLRLVVMGDMNEPPQHHAGVALKNLMLPLQRRLVREPGAFGTHKFHGQWTVLDQFLVSPSLLRDGDAAPAAYADSARIFHQPFMLIDDATHLGLRPLRSYYGYNYEGGFSDHLPILLNLVISQ